MIDRPKWIASRTSVSSSVSCDQVEHYEPDLQDGEVRNAQLVNGGDESLKTLRHGST